MQSAGTQCLSSIKRFPRIIPILKYRGPEGPCGIFSFSVDFYPGYPSSLLNKKQKNRASDKIAL